MIELGRGMIFPDSWAFGEAPGYEVETVSCPKCGEDRWAADEPCEHCDHEWGRDVP